jgi:hypothetical protein
MKPTADSTWADDWPERLRELIASAGAMSVSDLLARHPGEPYHKVAERLGGAVAPMQLKELHFEEANARGCLRAAAAEALVRTLADRVKRGWNTGRHALLNRASARAHWLSVIEHQGKAPHLRPTAEAVWHALETAGPPADWVPKRVDDPLVQKAFQVAWSHQEPTQ